MWGLTLQFLLGLFVLRTSIGQTTFSFLGKQVENFLSHVIGGVEFVFGENYKDFEFAFKVSLKVLKYFIRCMLLDIKIKDNMHSVFSSSFLTTPLNA